jgi:hypothetical protein
LTKAEVVKTQKGSYIVPMLTDQRIREIAEDAAVANDVRFAKVLLAPAIDSAGAGAIEIKFVLTPGSSAEIRGERSARTISEVIRRLADEGEQRFPIVRYEEMNATARS